LQGVGLRCFCQVADVPGEAPLELSQDEPGANHFHIRGNRSAPSLALPVCGAAEAWGCWSCCRFFDYLFERIYFGPHLRAQVAPLESPHQENAHHSNTLRVETQGSLGDVCLRVSLLLDGGHPHLGLRGSDYFLLPLKYPIRNFRLYSMVLSRIPRIRYIFWNFSCRSLPNRL